MFNPWAFFIYTHKTSQYGSKEATFILLVLFPSLFFFFPLALFCLQSPLPVPLFSHHIFLCNQHTKDAKNSIRHEWLKHGSILKKVIILIIHSVTILSAYLHSANIGFVLTGQSQCLNSVWTTKKLVHCCLTVVSLLLQQQVHLWMWSLFRTESKTRNNV